MATPVQNKNKTFGAFSSLDSAMKFDFDVPARYWDENQAENDFNLMDTSVLGDADTSKLSASVMKSHKKRVAGRRESKIRQLFKSCDSVLSSINDFF